jgi:hypothetical protein
VCGGFCRKVKLVRLQAPRSVTSNSRGAYSPNPNGVMTEMETAPSGRPCSSYSPFLTVTTSREIPELRMLTVMFSSGP